MVPISDRLQALLATAREASVEPNRVPLDDFLAGLQLEVEGLSEAQSKRTKLAICETILGLLSDASAVSTTVSRAMQTDAATISLWDILPTVRKEAYQHGFDDGKEHGYDQGIAEGMSIGNAEGLITGLEQGHADGLKMGLQQGDIAELERGIEIGRQMGHEEGLAEGMRRAIEEAKKDCGDCIMESRPKVEAEHKKIVVKLPPTGPVAEQQEVKKENVKPKDTGIDPFASLLGLARMR